MGRTLGSPGWKPTVRVGEAALREVAAYLLDHDRFVGVPHTVLVRARHGVFHYAAPQEGGGLPMKLGSLQVGGGLLRAADWSANNAALAVVWLSQFKPLDC